jgi:transcriptional regulator with XRE-family HTH domain
MERNRKERVEDENEGLAVELGRQARSARKARGFSIRSAAQHLRCSPRFVHQLELGKPTARMDKVQQALSGLGLQLSVHAVPPDGMEAQSPLSARVEARAKQGLYEEKLACAHYRIAALLALGEIPSGDISRARSQVRKWADGQICSPWYIDRWDSILAGTGRQIASRMVALGKDDAKALFQNTPFGFLARQFLRA